MSISQLLDKGKFLSFILLFLLWSFYAHVCNVWLLLWVFLCSTKTKPITLIGKKFLSLPTWHSRHPTLIQSLYNCSLILSHPAIFSSLNNHFPELNFGMLILDMIHFSMTVVSHSALSLYFMLALAQSRTD